MNFRYMYFLFVLAFLGCKKQNIEPFSSKDGIYFCGDSVVTLMSFGHYPNQDYFDIPIPVSIQGYVSDKDRDINIIVDSVGTLVNKSDFEIISTKVKAGSFNDSIYVRVFKSDKLNDNELMIRFRIESNEHFYIGDIYNFKHSIIFTNMLVKPKWWDTTMEKTYLGKYSTKKYSLFIQVTGQSDLTNTTNSYKRMYAIMLAEYVKANNVEESPGVPMVIPVIY